MTLNLFESSTQALGERDEFAPGAFLLPKFAISSESALLPALDSIVAQAPFRHMVTRGGFAMSVGMTNCGSFGWITDRKGYRYEVTDPSSGQPWPPMPDIFAELARSAAIAAGYPAFHTDACLINRYRPGARMSLHQDRNERDFEEPIVSVSLGIPATFLFGGFERADKQLRIPLAHGDVVVWGGPARLRYHGILPLKENEHPLLGACRINLTFRKAA